MKFLSVILALFVFVQSLSPCCSDDNCMDNNQTVKTEQTSNHEHDGDCEKNCSPFFVCGTCAGFIFPTVSFTLTSSVILFTKQISIYNQSTLSNFFHSIWQPPKIS